MKRRELKIEGDYITLGQFLKFAGAVGTGGAAREAIAAAEVLVNWEVEQRRGRKVRLGDVVTFEGVEYHVV